MAELGSVAELISAVATTGALVAAVVAARAAMQTTRQQGDELRRLRDADERRDAAGVAFWMAVDHDRRPGVRSSNSSRLPIYDLAVWVAVPGELLAVHYRSLGPTIGENLLSRTQRAMEDWAAGQETAVDWSRLFGADAIGCAACFRDTANRWWLRDFDGMLREVSSLAAGRAEVEARSRTRSAEGDVA